MINRVFFLPVLAFFLLLLTGCNKEEPGEQNLKVKNDTPEHAALLFARSVYEERTIETALSLSTPRLQRVLNSYHINSNVQRHIFNLKYDNVKIIPDGGNKIGRAQFAETASVTLFFTGTYGDDHIEDLRSVKLLRQDGQWKVDRIAADVM